MPILILGLIALAMFLVMGFLLFSAMMAERRSRMRRAAAGASVEAEADDETYKSRAASA